MYYNKAKAKNRIVIELGSNRTFEFQINNNGAITTCGGNSNFANKNEVAFEYSSSSCPINGNGGGSFYSVKGKKK